MQVRFSDKVKAIIDFVAPNAPHLKDCNSIGQKMYRLKIGFERREADVAWHFLL